MKVVEKSVQRPRNERKKVRKSCGPISWELRYIQQSSSGRAGRLARFTSYERRSVVNSPSEKVVGLLVSQSQ